jgi:hypothetical protein
LEATRKIFGGKIVRSLSEDAKKELTNYVIHNSVRFGADIGRRFTDECIESKSMKNFLKSMIDLADEISDDMFAEKIVVESSTIRLTDQTHTTQAVEPEVVPEPETVPETKSEDLAQISVPETKVD